MIEFGKCWRKMVWQLNAFKQRMQNCKDMTLSQLCLKINSKMGGTNNAIANNSITRLVYLPLWIIHQQRKSLTVKKDIKVPFFLFIDQCSWILVRYMVKKHLQIDFDSQTIFSNKLPEIIQEIHNFKIFSSKTAIWIARSIITDMLLAIH